MFAFQRMVAWVLMCEVCTILDFSELDYLYRYLVTFRRNTDPHKVFGQFGKLGLVIARISIANPLGPIMKVGLFTLCLEGPPSL